MNGLPANSESPNNCVTNKYIHTLDHLMCDDNCHNQSYVVYSMFSRATQWLEGDGGGVYGDLNTQVKGLNVKEELAKEK